MPACLQSQGIFLESDCGLASPQALLINFIYQSSLNVQGRKGMETVRIQAWCTVVAHACNPHTGRMCEAGGSCIPYYTVKHYLKNRTRILRVGWAAMCNWCSCRGPMFSCQNTLTLSLSLSQLHTHTHISEEVLPSCHSGIVPKALCLLCATRALPLIFALGPSYHACVC